MANILAHFLDRYQPSETLVMGVTSCLTGLGAATGIWCFKQLIQIFHDLFFVRIASWFDWLGPWYIVPLPFIGGILVGVLVFGVFGRRKMMGVSELIEAMATSGGRIPYATALVKATASALSIGSGASVGPEDPSVQMGASLGSLFGQRLKLSDERIKALTAAGAAAGIAAAFNAPIAGVFFALEVLSGEMTASAMGTLLIASVSSAILTQAMIGAEPAFHVPKHTLDSIHTLPFFIGLGALAGVISAIYIRLLHTIKERMAEYNAPNWLKPGLMGIPLGIVAVFLPQILGIGYETIEAVLHREPMGIWLLSGLLLSKLLFTPLCISAGFQGGVFAPALFLGAMLGGGYAEGMLSLFPQSPIDTAVFAMVGMAACLSGSIHAPLTAILLIFEMTNDYNIILPLMIAVTISRWLSQRIALHSIYLLGLFKRGIRIQQGRHIDLLERIKVEEVMSSQVHCLQETDSIEKAAQLFTELRTHGLPVVNANGELSGILTLQDINIALEKGQKQVKDACTRSLVVTYANEILADALKKMGARDIGRLPVVSRENQRRLIGILKGSDVVHAYNLALSQKQPDFMS